MTDKPQRKPNGRFAKGWCGGPGNPRVARLGEHQQAVARAVTGDELAAVLRKLRDLALAGDTAAARVLLDRVLGRPRETPAGLAIELPELRDATAIAEAHRRIVAAVAAGDVELDAGARLAQLVQAAAEATIVQQLEERVAAIEAGRAAC